MKEPKEILKLSNRTELEQIGSELSLGEIHFLLNHISKEKQYVTKILPILVGLNQGIFYQLIESLSEEEEDLLKNLGASEPLIHKLTVLAHNWKEDLDLLVKAALDISNKIAVLNLSGITKSDIFSIKQSIDDLDQTIEEHIRVLNPALSIAWNSKRIDLIDHLGSLKDFYLRTSLLLVGHSKNASSAPTGLYKKLEERLNHVYSLNNSGFALTLLDDHEPILEALTSLGIFYLEDYFFLGLLPTISSLKELRNLLRNRTPNELAAIQANLIAEVEKNLSSLGLKDVQSLKNANIYSREILKEFIAARLSPTISGS
ncbi:MAG: hypothetical protein ACSNEK_01465 [Parachlamydiaceae bacterium]